MTHVRVMPPPGGWPDSEITIYVDRDAAGAYWLGVLGFALAGPAAREDAALELEAYADLLDGDLNAVVLLDAIVIARGRE